MTSRRWLGALAAALVLIALAIFWRTRAASDDAPAPGGGPAATTRTTPATTGAAPAHSGSAAHHPAHTPEERAALLAAIAKARSQRTASPTTTTTTTAPAPGGSSTVLDIVDNTGDTSDWEKRTLATLNSLMGECYDLGRSDDPKLAGTLTFRFTLAGEPKVGGLLERVEIDDEHSSIRQAGLRDCVTQSLYALELDPPSEGVQVEREVSLKFP